MTHPSDNDWIVAAECGERRFAFPLDALPIRVGGGARDEVPLVGVAGSLELGVLDGVFFVQPDRETRSARVDGEPLTGSRRISDGSTLALDHARLECHLEDGRLRLVIDHVVTGGDTAPPDLEGLAREVETRDEFEVVPVAFKRAELPTAAASTRRSRVTRGAVGAGFAVLAALGWFAFTAKSVGLDISPAPEALSLPGTLFKLHLADRFLLFSGSHRVTATLPGYYPLDTTIEVGRLPDQSFSFELTKLPGLITLSSTPAEADVTLDGKPFGTTPLEDVEIPPGTHALEFHAQRFLPETRELVVEGGGEHQALAVELVPNWAAVSITSNPSGAEVSVDGEARGKTPAKLELEAGQRVVEVRLRGYNAWRDTLQVAANEPQELPPIKLALADGRVDLASVPSEAAVSVDGEFRGRTPLTVKLAPRRSHRITLTKPGYVAVSRELSVEADSGRRLQIELEAEIGEVEVRSTPADAEVSIDGDSIGTTPLRQRLTAVAHKIEVRRDGYAVERAEITPRPGYPQVLDLELTELDPVSGSGYPARLQTSLGQELKIVLPGEFTMGSSRRELDRRSNELLRPVKLTKAFYLGTREVSNREYRAFEPGHNSGSFGGMSLNDDDQPVVGVTWGEVAQYLNWLSIQDRLQPVYEQKQGEWLAVRPLRNGYRLPTEAEWAWAARFADEPTPLVYPWGAELPPPDRSGNYADLSAAKILPTTLVTYNDGYAVAAPSGSFPANAAGIYDLGGNVAEWIQDFYVLETASPPAPLTDPLGPESGRFHVVRGSSWRSATNTMLRLAFRDYADDSREDLGFRLARNLE